jgi:hypothetical protein
MSNLADLFNLRTIGLLGNCPDIGIGGFVYVLEHHDGLECYTYWSVNHSSGNGTGWQSARIYRREDADAGATILAECLGAERVFS